MIVNLIEDSEGLILPLGDEVCNEVGWEIGDEIKWTPDGKGGFVLSKVEKDTEWVMVETISSFRHRYLVEVPKGKAEWALDTVTCEEAKEMSQHSLGEQIFSHRVVGTKEEAIAEARKDENGYMNKWSDEVLEKNTLTHWKEQNGN